MDCSTPGFPVHHQLLELAQTHVHWVSDAIQPSHPLSSPSPPALNLSQHQGLFQWVSSSHQVMKVSELPFSTSPFNEYSGLISFRIDWSPCCPRDSQESSPIPQFKSISSSTLSLPYGPTLTSLLDYWKNHSFDYVRKRTFVGKVMSLLFNTLSSFVILPRSKHHLISWLQSLSVLIFELKKIKFDTVSTFSPSIYHEVVGPDAMILVFWMLSLRQLSHQLFHSPLYLHQEVLSFSFTFFL